MSMPNASRSAPVCSASILAACRTCVRRDAPSAGADIVSVSNDAGYARLLFTFTPARMRPRRSMAAC